MSTTRKRFWISDTLLRCEKCPFSTHYKCDFRRHVKRHQTYTFPCDKCGKPFATEGHYKGHHRDVHGEEGTAYSNSADREEIPLRNKKKPKRWQCNKCDYSTIYKTDMSKHTVRHESSVFDCKICRRPFALRSLHEAHLRKAHGMDENYCLSSLTKLASRSPVRSQRKKKRQKAAKSKGRRNSIPSEIRNRPMPRINADITKWKRPSSLPVNEGLKINTNGEERTIIETDEASPEKTGDLPTVNKSRVQSTRKNVDRSKETATKTRSIPCVFCEFTASSYGALKIHLDEHDFEEDNRQMTLTTETVFVRTVVGKMADGEVSLDKHDTCDKKGAFGAANGRKATNGNGGEFNKFTGDTVGSMTAGNDEDIGSDQSEDAMGEDFENSSNKSDCLNKSDYMSDIELGDEEVVWPRDNDMTSNFTDENLYSDQQQNMDIETTNDDDNQRSSWTPYACSCCSFQTGVIVDLVKHAESHVVQNKLNKDSFMSETPMSIEEKTDTNEGDNPTTTFNELDQHTNKDEEGIISEELFRTKTGQHSGDGSNIGLAAIASQHDGRSPNASLTGRLTKEHFNKHGRFYCERVEEFSSGERLLECLICDPGCVFTTTENGRLHFKLVHGRLREKICESCDFCNGPFPK